MQADPWLERWLPLLQADAADAPVLEIGCGTGADTETLVGAGLSVLAFDLSPAAIEQAHQRVPQARFLVRDARASLPVPDQGVGTVVASLSLHYFSWADTVAVFGRLHQALRTGGLLLCRLNSTEDVHHGARGHPEIEPNYYRVDGQPKRFFDRPAIDALLAAGWVPIAIEHRVTDKYERPKAVWEFACRKAAA